MKGVNDPVIVAANHNTSNIVEHASVSDVITITWKTVPGGWNPSNRNQALQIWFLFWEGRNHLHQSTATSICSQLQKLLIRSRSNIARRVLRMRCTDIRIQEKSAHDQNL